MLRPKHPNDMDNAEYNEWISHPELADWVKIKPIYKNSIRGDLFIKINSLAPPESTAAAYIALVVALFGVYISYKSLDVSVLGLSIGLFAIVLMLFTIRQAILRQTWQQEQYQRMQYNLPK